MGRIASQAGLTTAVVVAITQAISYAVWGGMEGGYDTSIIVAGTLIPMLTCLPITTAFLLQKARLHKAIADLHEAHAVMRRQALRDPMTGLPHRQAFLDSLGSFAPVSSSGIFMMIDADNFKSVNDTLGHAAGDRALIAIANALANAKRGEDILARYGGEEFCMYCPATTIDEGTIVAERLRKAVASAPFASANGTCRLTVSIGVAPSLGHSPVRGLEAADMALYEAKRSGRNRVVATQQVQGLATAA